MNIKEQSVVVISRDWHKPHINIDVTCESISIKMNLEDFLEALVEEAKSPALVMTRSHLKRRLKEASKLVCEKMKLETKAVV